MNIVILGAGRVGYQLARQLIEENRDVAVIERDQKRAKFVSDRLDCLVIHEDGNRLEALRQAGIQKAEHFIAVTDSDEVNLIACGMVANQFDVSGNTARVRGVDYTGDGAFRHAFLGIDYVVNPEIEVTRAITAAIERGAVSDIMLFEESDLQVRSVRIDAESMLIGRSVEQMRDSVGGDFLVVVLLRGNDYIIPTASTLILENDKLYLLATETDFDSIFTQMGKTRARMERVVVIGGAQMGQHVLEYLLKGQSESQPLIGRIFQRLKGVGSGKKITVIESDYETCKALSERFPKALVINADISDEQFEEDEHFAKADLVVATTDNQELNIINAVYAKTLGTKRSVALVNRSNYVHIASSLGIDVAISPVDSMVSSILKHIRSSNVRRVHNISGSSIDIIELSVEEKSIAVGRRIRDVNLPQDSLIIAITRQGGNIFPNPDLSIEGGDHLITIANKESIPKLEQIFTE